MPAIRDRYDALVIGGGIAGMQAALDLGEQGYEVLLVERDPSIGGVMVGLNKVFPTLDCSSCICTPRMAEAAHHPRIQLQTCRRCSGSRRTATASGSRCCASRATSTRTSASAATSASSSARSTCRTSSTTASARAAPSTSPTANAIPQKAVLDLEHCVFCGKCEKACPTDCLRLRPAAGGRRDARWGR